MNPRTFLPGPRLAVARTPQPGDSAPALTGDLESGRPAIVAFLRHTGCPFAEATLRMLREHAAKAPEVQWVAITQAPAAATEQWCSGSGGAGEVRLVCDEHRAAYARWGLGQTSLGHFMGRRSLSGVARLARQGIRNTHPHGTRWQSAGTFALDADGVVRWRHLPSHAGDLPDIDGALRALR